MLSVPAANLCQEHTRLLTECELCRLTRLDLCDDFALLVVHSGCIGHTDIFACAFSVDLLPLWDTTISIHSSFAKSQRLRCDGHSSVLKM